MRSENSTSSNFCLLVFTNGRKNCLTQTIDSFNSKVVGDFKYKIIINDCQDADYQDWLDSTFNDFFIAHNSGNDKWGFAGAVQMGWSLVPADADYVFHLEDDFTFNEQININNLRWILEHREDLIQVALMRQPWNEEEKAAGGVVQCDPDSYTQFGKDSLYWFEHRKFFTTNPSLYRADLIGVGWPDAPYSEGIFTHKLLADPNISFGFLGMKYGSPKVHHIGVERIGSGY